MDSLGHFDLVLVIKECAPLKCLSEKHHGTIAEQKFPSNRFI